MMCVDSSFHSSSHTKQQQFYSESGSSSIQKAAAVPFRKQQHFYSGSSSSSIQKAAAVPFRKRQHFYSESSSSSIQKAAAVPFRKQQQFHSESCSGEWMVRCRTDLALWNFEKEHCAVRKKK